MAGYTPNTATLTSIAAALPANLKSVYNMNLLIDDFSFVTDGTVFVQIFFKADPTRFALTDTLIINAANDFVSQVVAYINSKQQLLLDMNTRRTQLLSIATKNA